LFIPRQIGRGLFSLHAEIGDSDRSEGLHLILLLPNDWNPARTGRNEANRERNGRWVSMSEFKGCTIMINLEAWVAEQEVRTEPFISLRRTESLR
jgi:hypothetical protein